MNRRFASDQLSHGHRFLLAVARATCRAPFLLAFTLVIFTAVRSSRFAIAQADQPVEQKKPQRRDSPALQPGAGKSTTKSDDPTRFQPFGYVMHEHSVSIVGRTLDGDGEPVRGARVLVIPVAPSGVPYGKELKILAETTSNREGKYQLENVALTALEFAPQAVPKPTEAHFQVFALADGYGYVWRRVMSYRPEKRVDDASERLAVNPDAKSTANSESEYIFYGAEPIVVDLDFSPEIRFYGTIADNHGNPLKGAIVRVGLITTGRQMPTDAPNMWQGSYLLESRRAADKSFNGFAFLPEEFRTGTSDDDGHFEIPGLPRDCEFLASIDYRPEYEPWVSNIQTGIKIQPDGTAVQLPGALNRTFVAPVTVRVKIVDSDNTPIAGVIVRQDAERQARRSGSIGRTGPDGIATLKLPPENSTLMIEPNFDQPFLPEKLRLEINAPKTDEAVDLVSKLVPAAEVVFEAIEQQTGVAIGGIAFLSEPADVLERRPVQSQLSFVDHPQTNEAGVMHTFLEPGQWRFLVDPKRSSAEFEAINPMTEFIDVTPDAPTKVRFEFVKRPNSRPEFGTIPDQVRPFAERLKQQYERFERQPRFRFQLRTNNNIPAKMSREQMTSLLDSFASMTVDQCIDSIRREFPEFRGFGEFQLIMEGTKRRVDFRHPGSVRPEVNMFNGEETLISMDSGRQLDIYDSKNTMLHFLDRSDFWSGPAQTRFLMQPKQQPGKDGPSRSFRQENGVVEIETISGTTTQQMEIDSETGFIRRTSINHQGSAVGEETRQLFPTILSDGVVVPKLSVKVYYYAENKLRFAVTVIDRAELPDRLAPDAFLVEASPGTNVIDYRGIPRDEIGRGRRARSGVLSAAVPDVVAYRNKFAPAREPILKIGQDAPKFNLTTWLNASGEIDAPEWKGKIVVIDFWGIGCGPCVAQLPEVNEAAKHFANSKIVIVGLHTSGAPVADVATFVQKKGLVFPTAIDEPDMNSRTFGKTFAAYGIDAIPSTAVIDTTGRVVYLGAFKQAIEIANKLATE